MTSVIFPKVGSSSHHPRRQVHTKSLQAGLDLYVSADDGRFLLTSFHDYS